MKKLTCFLMLLVVPVVGFASNPCNIESKSNDGVVTVGEVINSQDNEVAKELMGRGEAYIFWEPPIFDNKDMSRMARPASAVRALVLGGGSLESGDKIAAIKNIGCFTNLDGAFLEDNDLSELDLTGNVELGFLFLQNNVNLDALNLKANININMVHAYNTSLKSLPNGIDSICNNESGPMFRLTFSELNDDEIRKLEDLKENGCHIDYNVKTLETNDPEE